MAMDIPPPRGSILPTEIPPFRGVIGKTYKESKPDWPQRQLPPADAPHVVLIMCDDLGFGQLSCYGGPVEAPNIGALAAGGLRYTNFHTTSLCSPSRAALLTGRNHHSVGFSAIAEMAKGFPGSNTFLPKSAATIAEVLRQTGYSTYCCGKWHLTPFAEGTAAGPFDRWPLGLGFERFYGFLPAAVDHWHPILTVDNHRIPTPQSENYHLTEDIVDQAIGMLRNQRQIATGRPVFLYVPFGAPHTPLHAPKAFIERYRGRFDEGWDAIRQRTFARQKELGVIPVDCDLPPRNPGVKEWATLTSDERRLFARLMEVFAGMVDHADAQIGRLVNSLAELEMLDNTLIMFLSDNGASQEGMDIGSTNMERLRNLMPISVAEMLEQIDEIGGRDTDPHYPKGWAMAGNTPFRRYKRDTHRGGNADPLIVHWPARIADKGAIRTQYTHIIDIYPTLLEVAGLAAPSRVNGVEQKPIEGKSFVSTLFDGEASQTRTVQYYEMLGSRAIWSDGWTAVTWHKPGTDWEHDRWELYHQDVDYSQAHDLAQTDPERLKAMVDLWWKEAQTHNVLPLDDRGIRFYDPSQPKASLPQRIYRYYPGTVPIPNPSLPVIVNRRHSFTAHVMLRSSSDRGILFAVGGSVGGFALYVRGRRLVYVNNNLKLSTTALSSDCLMPLGREVEVRYEWHPIEVGVGEVKLFLNDAGTATMARVHTAPLGYTFVQEGLQIGRGWGPSIAPDHYDTPFEFTGSLRAVELEIYPPSEAEVELDRQLRERSAGAP